MPMPPMKNVDSSKVFQLGYDEKEQALYVRFVPNRSHPAGRVAIYSGVPQQTADQITNAPSIGGALKDFVEGIYPFTYI
jgi:hypothetical protein